jgi:hypothetical protein
VLGGLGVLNKMIDMHGVDEIVLTSVFDEEEIAEILAVASERGVRVVEWRTVLNVLQD